MAFLRGVNLMSPSPNDSIPLIVHVAYQMMFAIITPALITGAFANRVTFKAYFIFLTLWLLLVYFPFVHMIWGNGLLAQWGVLDYAGGIVVHNTAGIAALASVIFVGRRRVQDTGPHSIPLVALGTGLLWFGWYGFNAGSEFRVDATTVAAFINTDLAASFAGVTWLLVEWMTTRKPKFLGLLTGSVAGLATITPVAGYVSPQSAVRSGSSRVSCAFTPWRSRTSSGGTTARRGVCTASVASSASCCSVFATKAYNPAGATAPGREHDALRSPMRRGRRLVRGRSASRWDAVAHRSRDAGAGRRGARGDGPRPALHGEQAASIGLIDGPANRASCGGVVAVVAGVCAARPRPADESDEAPDTGLVGGLTERHPASSYGWLQSQLRASTSSAC
jgi:hypothetical protein